MKDLLPLAVMQSTNGGDLKVTTGTKTGSQQGLKAPANGVSADLPDSDVSFLDSLNGLLHTGGMQDGTTVETALGGKSAGGNTLPLFPSAAGSVPSIPLPLSTEVQTQQDIAPMAGLSPLLQATAPHVTDTFSSTEASTDLSKSGQQTAPLLSSRLTVDTVPQTAKPLADETALQTGNTPVKPDVLIPTRIPLAQIQLDTLEASQKLDGINRDTAVKVGLIPQTNKADMVDVQLALKADTLLNETDRLFTSRMQLASVNQTGELAGNRLATEALLSATQAASTDAIHASLVRSSIPQTAVAANPLTSPVQAAVAETVGMAGWGQGMGKQVLWMVNQNISRAEIRLNPANLGPIEVRIDMDNDQVNVAFTSRHAEVREAVEQALPRLREMLEEKGLNLSDADVSQHSFTDQHNSAFGHADKNSGLPYGLSMNTEDDLQAIDNDQAGMRRGMDYLLNEGLVDYYI